MSTYTSQSGTSTSQPSSTGGILGGGATATGGASGPSAPRSGWFGQSSQQQYGQQQHGASWMTNITNWMQGSLQNSSEFMRRYVNQYPLLAGYLFTLMAFSAVPVSIYTIFGLVSAIVLLSIALIGFAAIEGTILLASGGLLLTVLGTITFFSTLGFGFVAFVWLGFKSFRMVFGRVWEGAGYVTSTVGQKLQESMPPMTGGSQQQSGQYSSGQAGMSR